MSEQGIHKVKHTGTQIVGRVLGNRMAPHILSVLGVASVLLVTSWLWVQSRQRFPKLPRGYYFGQVEFSSSESEQQSKTVPIFIESTEGDEFYIALMNDDWPPQLVTYVERGDSGSGNWVHPIVIVTGDRHLRFTGAPTATDRYAGTVKMVESSIEGSWNLRPLTLSPHSGWRMDDEALDHWLRLQAELKDTMVALVESKKRLESQNAEVNQLTEFITDSDRLKEKSEQRFLKAKSEWVALKKEVEGMREEAKKLERQVALAQRITQNGTLVSLARESLDRESRWVESMFRSEVDNSGADFLNGVRYGERVMALREEIAREREKISNLRMIQERRTGIQREVQSFGQDTPEVP